jgi:voltage-gated potassium channel Kch
LWLQDYESSVGYEINNWQNQYLIGFYWATVTMITVGYGDIVPQTHSSRIFTIFAMLIASGIFGYIMNKIALIFQEMEMRKEQAYIFYAATR